MIKTFLDKLGPPDIFLDTSLRCRVSSELNGVIMRHIDRSIFHKTSTNAIFQIWYHLRMPIRSVENLHKSAIFGVLADFKILKRMLKGYPMMLNFFGTLLKVFGYPDLKYYGIIMSSYVFTIENVPDPPPNGRFWSTTLYFGE